MIAEVQYSLRTRVEEFLRKLQDEITSTLQVLDGAERFHQETWERPGGGGGRTRVLTEGEVFEKAGVNFSAVHGEAPDSMKGGAEQLRFFATGV